MKSESDGRNSGNKVVNNKTSVIRERDIHRQVEDSEIREANYNMRYKELFKNCSRSWYLQRKNLDDINIGDRVRALVKTRCGNLEETNKYWLADDHKKCIFCNIG